MISRITIIMNRVVDRFVIVNHHSEYFFDYVEGGV